MELREFAVGLVVGLALVALLAVGVGWEELLAKVLAADRSMVLLALAASVATVSSYAAATYVLVRQIPGAPGPGRFGLLYFAGVFTKQAVPLGNAGGPALLAYIFSRYSDAPVERTLLATTVAAVFSFAASVVVAGGGFAAVALSRPLPGWFLQLAAVLTLAVALAFAGLVALALRPGALEDAVRSIAAAGYRLLGPHSARLERNLNPVVVDARIDRFVETGENVAHAPRAVAMSFGFSVLGWLFAGATLSLSLVAVGLQPDFAAAAVAVPLSGVANAVPLPGGLGGVEVTLAGLVSLLGSGETATVGAAVVIFRVASFWFRLAVGGIAALAVLGSFGVGDAALADVEESTEEQ
ncbi:lysylphosphatidylglycerol synthase transmembrane domain-containing protein [Haloarchaeobius sp. DFWS5]|uniref:lysylphosphatidylglycerol synthase transmembrane domain-containing protein n=1 Tax=Haloarchaeobius sp. DFWS5 TaxID=3446114 RepID=UPI003EBFAD46